METKGHPIHSGNKTFISVVTKRDKVQLHIYGEDAPKLGFVIWNKDGAYRIFHRALVLNQEIHGCCIDPKGPCQFDLNWSDGLVIDNIVARMLLGE